MGATAFNPKPGLMRFRPVRDRGRVVPTAYAGETGVIAIAETKLRRAALTGTRVIYRTELRGAGIVKLACRSDLELIALNGMGLRRLDLDRADVIDTGPDKYAETAAIAQQLYDAHPRAQGLVWTSHQSDDGDAMILWGTRVRRAELSVIEGPYRLDDGPGFLLAQRAAEMADVVIVD